jgi:hypothetical protein
MWMIRPGRGAIALGRNPCTGHADSRTQRHQNPSQLLFLDQKGYVQQSLKFSFRVLCVTEHTIGTLIG